MKRFCSLFLDQLKKSRWISESMNIGFLTWFNVFLTPDRSRHHCKASIGQPCTNEVYCWSFIVIYGPQRIVMYSNMVTSALFYHFHSPICLVMGGCGQGWWLKRPHWTRVGPWWLCEPQNKIPGPVMLYPSRLATLKHRNPYTGNALNWYIMRPVWLEFLYHSTAANAQRYNIPNTMHRTLNTICI